MIYQLSREQYETLRHLATGDSVTFTSFGDDPELNDLIRLGLLSDVSKAFKGQLAQWRTTAGDTGRVLCLTESGLKFFSAAENASVN